MNLKEKQLYEAVEELSDENQSHLLGVLEALYFVQNEREGAAIEQKAVTP
ncbi:MAG: hypothetical protein FWB99_03190 [Treponema sp.]|nr:hypothetical protein [Treponema sp.]